MTRQKNPMDRKEEIISAALEVLNEKGLAGLTMEAVIAHTPLSKGGVYRFYANKNELMAEVLHYIAEAFMPIDPEEAITWNLPLRDTLHRLIFATFHKETGLMLRRIHIQLMQQLPQEEALLRSAQETFHAVLHKYRKIILAVVKRDNLKIRSDFEATLVSAIDVGQSLFDGLVLNNLGGLPIDEVEVRMSAFIELVIRAIVKD